METDSWEYLHAPGTSSLVSKTTNLRGLKVKTRNFTVIVYASGKNAERDKKVKL